MERVSETPILSEPFLTRSTWRPFLVVTAISLLGLAAWACSPARYVFDSVDMWVARAVNATLLGPDFWQALWALANHRSADFAMGMTIIGLAIAAMPIRTHRERSVLALRIVWLAIATGAASWMTEILVHRVAGYERLSPTLALEDMVRLSDHVRWLDFKYGSEHSFPGDHGFVLILCFVFIRRYAARRWAWAMAALVVGFALPRLMVGAHWLTDIAVGSATFAAIAGTLAFHSPLNDFVERVIALIVERFSWQGTDFRFARVAYRGSSVRRAAENEFSPSRRRASAAELTPVVGADPSEELLGLTHWSNATEAANFTRRSVKPR